MMALSKYKFDCTYILGKGSSSHLNPIVVSLLYMITWLVAVNYLHLALFCPQQICNRILKNPPTSHMMLSHGHMLCKKKPLCVIVVWVFAFLTKWQSLVAYLLRGFQVVLMFLYLTGCSFFLFFFAELTFGLFAMEGQLLYPLNILAWSAGYMLAGTHTRRTSASHMLRYTRTHVVGFKTIIRLIGPSFLGNLRYILR